MSFICSSRSTTCKFGIGKAVNLVMCEVLRVYAESVRHLNEQL